MHGTELSTFVCAAGKERTLHFVSMHAVILASGSLTNVDGKAREARAMQTLNFQKPEDLAAKRVPRRCRDCTLAAWKSCHLPSRGTQRRQRQVRELAETVFR